MEHDFKFTGFISYSQKDRKWARKIHKALEAYRLPSRLGGQKLSKRKLGKFFRDEDEFSGAPSLSAALTGAIDDSKTMIVICSPNAVSSKWVDEEVRHFKRRGEGARVLPVIVSGQPDAVEQNEQCFPPTLFRAVAPDGTVGEHTGEPLGPDVRKEKFARLITRLAAGIMEVDFDALWKREKRRIFRRRMMMAATTVGVVAIGGLIALYGQRGVELANSAVIVQGSDTAYEERRFMRSAKLAAIAARPGWTTPTSEGAQDRFSRSLKIPREVGLLNFEWGFAEVLHTEKTGYWLLLDINGYGAAYPSLACINGCAEPVFHFRYDVEARPVLYSQGSRLLLWSNSGSLTGNQFHGTGAHLQVISTEDGQEVFSTSLESDISDVVLTTDGDYILVVQGNGVDIISSETGRKIHHVQYLYPVSTIELLDRSTACVRFHNGAGEYLDVSGNSNKQGACSEELSNDLTIDLSADRNTVNLLDSATGVTVSQIENVMSSDIQIAVSVKEAKLSPNGRYLSIFGVDGVLRIWDIDQSRLMSIIPVHGRPVSSFLPDSQHIVIWSDRHNFSVRNIQDDRLVLGSSQVGVSEVNSEAENGITVVLNIDQTVELYDLEKLSLISTLDFGPGVRAYSAWLADDSRYIITSTSDRSKRVWDVNSGQELFRVYLDTDHILLKLFVEQGVFVAQDSRGQLRIWDIGLAMDPVKHLDNGQELCLRSLGKKPVRERLEDGNVDLTVPRIVDQTDLELAPILEGRLGEDVCAYEEPWWYPVTRKLVSWLPE